MTAAGCPGERQSIALRGGRGTSPRSMLDASALFLLQGYDFIGRRCDRQGGDVAGVRLLMRPTVLLRGTAAARLVYDTERFARKGALPKRARRTLVGEGGVQTLDGHAHRHRKRLFLDVLTPEAAQQIADEFLEECRRRLPEWEAQGRVRLHTVMGEALCAAVSQWSGLGCPSGSVTARTRELEALIGAAARVGPAYWRGVRARRRAESALASVISEVRTHPERVRAGSALHHIAEHVDETGRLLPPRIAAVELLNVLRPTVAIDRYIMFVAHALHQYPDWRSRLQGDSHEDRERFVHEVRRYYPFFPSIAAVARRPVTVAGRTIPAGRRVMLDVYGTNRDAAQFSDPHRFNPDRFTAAPGPFDMIPQGGGDVAAGHRCAGEAVTVAVMKAATALLVDEIDYDVPRQNLHISRRRIPTGPASGMVLDGVRRRAGTRDPVGSPSRR
jgi:fatty-acid peroxygenase